MVPSSCLRSVWHFAGNAFHRRVPRLSIVSGLFREMPLIVLSWCLRSVWHFAGNAFDLRVWMFQERLAFYCKCLWWSCAIFQERLAFYGKCLSSSCVHPWGVSGILSKCRLSSFVHFEERLAFSWKNVLSSCAMCFKSVWHFMRIAFDRRVHMFQERKHFTGNGYYIRVFSFEGCLAF